MPQGFCGNYEGIYVCRLFDDVLFYGERVSCRKALALDAEVSRRLGARVVVLGLLAKEGFYQPGVGWV